MADSQADLLIIGAGIVGLATALEFARRFPGKRLLSSRKKTTSPPTRRDTTAASSTPACTTAPAR